MINKKDIVIQGIYAFLTLVVQKNIIEFRALDD